MSAIIPVDEMNAEDKYAVRNGHYHVMQAKIGIQSSGCRNGNCERKSKTSEVGYVLTADRPELNVREKWQLDRMDSADQAVPALALD